MWAYESVFYQIYPLGFCGAPFENDGELNRRILKVFLTSSGKKQVDRLKPLRDRMLATQYKGFNDTEIEVLITLLRKVRKNIIEEYDLKM